MRALISFESRNKPLLPRRAFLLRLARSFVAGLGLVAISLAAGMAGYHFLESLSWLDAFVNASMILSGMGPLANPQTTGGKLFAGCYALYSGLVVIIIAGIIFAPLFHRFLHKFHVEDEAEAEKESARARRSRGSAAKTR